MFSGCYRNNLTPNLVQAFRKHRARQNETKLLRGAAYEDNDLVFCEECGVPIVGERSIRKSFYTTLKRAGCPRIRLHDLRHSYASLLMAQSASPKYISNSGTRP